MPLSLLFDHQSWRLRRADTGVELLLLLLARRVGRDVAVEGMENASTTGRECDEIIVMLIAAAAAVAMVARDLRLLVYD